MSDDEKISDEEASEFKSMCDNIPDEFLIPAIQQGLTTVFKDSHDKGAELAVDTLKAISSVSANGEGSSIAALHGAIMIICAYVLKSAPNRRMAKALIDSAVSAAAAVQEDDDDSSEDVSHKFKW